MLLKLTIQLLTVILVIANDAEDAPEVTVAQGRIKGKYLLSRQGKKISAFQSIPYAEPPLGDLRFQPPVPGGSWKGTLDGTKHHAVCPQRNIYTRSEIIEGDENCLFLNVYTPQVPPVPNPNYAVMVFLHGGGWLSGGGNSKLYGPEVLLDKDVVLVVPNYRLGALGFLSVGDEILPGNNGLKDQSLALKWVANNIVKFGGDPNRVTIFGESAGGASSHLHMMSPLSKGLFHASISQSGTVHAPWSIAKPGEGEKQAHKLANAFNCSVSTTKRMLDCLRKIEPFDLVAKDSIFMEWDIDPMIPFRPVVEPDLPGAFLSEHPNEIIKSGKTAPVPWMTGLTTEEGAIKVAGADDVCTLGAKNTVTELLANQPLMKDLDENFNKIVPISLFYKDTCTSHDLVSSKIRKFYLGTEKISNDTRYNIIDMYTDGWFLHGADESVRQHLAYSSQPVYYYLFGHHGVSSFSKIFGDPHQRYGVCHGDDLQYLFPVGNSLFPSDQMDELDKRVTNIVTTLWTNFAKYRNPTPDVNYMLHTKWEPVKSEKFEFYYIGGGMHSANGLFWERAQFWRNLKIKWYSQCMKNEL